MFVRIQIINYCSFLQFKLIKGKWQQKLCFVRERAFRQPAYAYLLLDMPDVTTLFCILKESLVIFMKSQIFLVQVEMKETSHASSNHRQPRLGHIQYNE